MKSKTFPFGPNISTVYRFFRSLNAGISRHEIKAILSLVPVQNPLSLLTVSEVLKSFHFSTSAYKISPDCLKSIDTPFFTFYPRKGRRRLVLIEEIDSKNVTFYLYNEGLVKEDLLSFEKNWNGIFLSGKQINNSCLSIKNGEIEKQENKIIEDYRQNGIEFVPNFLTELECDDLIGYAEEKCLFEQSLVDNYGKLEISKSRTSYSAFLPDIQNPVMDSIYKKAGTFLNKKRESIEDLQIVRYLENQEFKPHYDPKGKFDRKYTMLVYLNDTFEGGETYFPEINVKITPKKGAMLCFLNRDDDNNVLPLSIHAGLPVHKGIKYGCNIWISSTSMKEEVLKI